jgi:hypothetical protein
MVHFLVWLGEAIVHSTTSQVPASSSGEPVAAEPGGAAWLRDEEGAGWVSHRSGRIELGGLRKPGKAVAVPQPFLAASLEEAVSSLAYACTGSGEQAKCVRRLFERAAAEGNFALLFRRWWQEKTLAPLPAGAVVQPWVTLVHQQIANRFASWQLLGDQPLLLPCPGCGRVFTSRPPRFARACGRCKAYTPSGQANPDGSRVMFSAGFYPAGPHGPSQGQSILCAHPDCVRVFLATSSQRRYCDEHQRDRKAAARARSRTSQLKHTRVRFYPAARCEQLPSVSSRDGSEGSVVVGPDGYQPRDERELLLLAQLAGSGRVEVCWNEDVHTSPPASS